MKNIKNMNKKNMLIIGGAVVVLIILVCIIGFVLSNKKEKGLSLEESLTKFASDFYENHYYTGIKEKESLANYSEDGLNISVKAATVIIPLDEETQKLFDKNKCDSENTKIFFYPNSPYSAKDYKIKVELSCEK